MDNEIKKYNNLKKQMEEEKAFRMNYGKETKESFIETIIEKDKKIRELELKKKVKAAKIIINCNFKAKITRRRKKTGR